MERDIKWSAVSLCIASQALSTVEITRILDTRPHSTTEKGSPVSKRNPSGPVQQQSVWMLESGVNSNEPLETHITKLVEYIEAHRVLLEGLLSNCTIDLRCSFSSSNGQGGFVLDTLLLKRLSALPIDLIVDLYPPENEGLSLES